MITKRVDVTFSVSVTLDETKFTPEFMKEYNEAYEENLDLDDHFKLIAYLDVINNLDNDQGYGDPYEMGIKVSTVDVFEEIQFECKGE
jgi:hypothetical protein